MLLTLLDCEDADTAHKPACSAAISSTMAQDASVRVRRAAFTLWLTHHQLHTAKAGTAEPDHNVDVAAKSIPELEAVPLQQLADRVFDKYAFTHVISSAMHWLHCITARPYQHSHQLHCPAELNWYRVGGRFEFLMLVISIL